MIAIEKILFKISQEKNVTSLMNLNDANRKEVSLFLSEIVINLMLEEGIELSENINLSFVNFTANQWQNLDNLIKEKITINC